MDPFAHTLAGAALAATGLRHQARYATAALIIGANLPDIDVLATFWGEDAMLEHRRGWTHGILAMVVLPWLLLALIWLWHRFVGVNGTSSLPWRPGRLLALCYLAIASHPLLDWLNTYGVRLLMPFDGTWFYGDTLFIVDPWLWLLPLAAVMLAWQGPRTVLMAASVFSALATLLVLATDLTPLFVKLLWCLLLPVILLLAWRGWHADASQRLAQLCLATALVYIAGTWAMARQAEARAAQSAPQPPLQVQANPLPGSPLAHRLLLVHEDHYQLQTADGMHYRVAREAPGPVVQAALASPEVSGFVTWMRFPYWTVQETDSGWTVHLYDLRYQGPDEPAAGIGHARVAVRPVDLPGAALPSQ